MFDPSSNKDEALATFNHCKDEVFNWGDKTEALIHVDWSKTCITLAVMFATIILTHVLCTLVFKVKADKAKGKSE